MTSPINSYKSIQVPSIELQERKHEPPSYSEAIESPNDGSNVSMLEEQARTTDSTARVHLLSEQPKMTNTASDRNSPLKKVTLLLGFALVGAAVGTALAGTLLAIDGRFNAEVDWSVLPPEHRESVGIFLSSEIKTSITESITSKERKLISTILIGEAIFGAIFGAIAGAVYLRKRS